MNCIERYGAIGLALLATLGLVAFPACAGRDLDAPAPVRVQLLDLDGPMAVPEAEISSMTWQGDTLIMLPQFPDKFAGDGMLAFFALSKKSILEALDGDTPEPLQPHQVDCHAPGLAGVVKGFDGLEAMGCIGHRYFMTVEAEDDTVMAGFLVSGNYDMVNDVVLMDMTRLIPIPMGLNIPNIAEETLLIDGERVITISEANGRNVNPTPNAKVFNTEAEFVGLLPMPNIEYRVTDATALDEHRRFWVINYYYPAEGAKIDQAPDPELTRHGGPAFDPTRCVERLLELEVRDDRIVRTETPPINLELLPDGRCRNWEALVRLDDRGFLLMTDKYPGTLLAFVPYPE